jgi:two-component system response regulator AtoC
MSATLLLVDDEEKSRFFLGQSLRKEGYEVLAAGTMAEALSLLQEYPIDLALVDLMLPDGDGLTILQAVKLQHAALPVIIFTGYGAVTSAVQAIKQGAYDYIEKPVDVTKLKVTIAKALETLALHREIDRLQATPDSSSGATLIVGHTRAMQQLVEMVTRVAPTQTTVLIRGETGTGKDVVARTLHRQSKRSSGPFVPVNCTAIPDALLETELFGYERGAFTGAHRRKRGVIEEADHGTLLLDEVGAMKADMQSKLLRVLEDRKLRRVGGETDIAVDIRIIAATNTDLRAAVAEGRFREDLYYRLCVVDMLIPPLRQRIEDLELFIASFLAEFNRALGKQISGVSPTALDLMRAYSWPGNTRELRNILERAVILCDDEEIQPTHLPQEITGTLTEHLNPSNPFLPYRLSKGGLDLRTTLDSLEQSLIRQALDQAEGDWRGAAALLSLSPEELRQRAANSLGTTEA